MEHSNLKRSLLPFLLMISLTQAPGQVNPLHFEIQGRRMELQWYAPDIVRVRLSPVLQMSEKTSLSVIASPAQVDYTTKEAHDTIRLSTRIMAVNINKRTGELKFFDSGGREFLAARGPGQDSFAPVPEGGGYHVKQTFTVTAGEGLYGLGQFEDPVVNYRGRDILIAQANRTAVNPFLVSSMGYGLLWDNYSQSRFSDSPEGTSFRSEVADDIDYYVVYGPALDKVIAGYRTLTGKAPLFGKWAYGYWQSKERYKSSAEVIDIVREYRRRNIPLDNIVQDWAYWGGMDQFSSMMWDHATYPDPRAMADTIHQLHAHLMVSIWPAFAPATDIYKEMDARHFLYPVAHWNGGKVYDAYNPAAREIYWKYVKQGLFDNGVDAFWMDATEPEFRCSDDRYITGLSLRAAGNNFLGSFARYLTPYSLMTTRAVYENHRRLTGAKRVFILTRSGFAGQQRYGAATWSGDTYSTWDDLRVQIAAGINFSLSGIPYWTHDIGGFITDIHFPRGLSDPAYKELYVRWFQFGAFCPIFRAHGTNLPREVWQFGAPGDWAYDALVASDRLRYRLMPYIYSTAWKVTNEDFSFIRGLMADFPGDANVLSIPDQYMFGSSLMVCPVTHPILHPPEYKGVDITPCHFYSADGNEHGMELQIFRDTHFDTLLLSRRTDASQIGWTGCLPGELDTAYSIRMTGSIQSDATGPHTFHVITDGGIRLWLDNRVVIDDTSNSTRKTFSVVAELSAGAKHPFRLEHRQFKANNALLKINWEQPETGTPDAQGRTVYLPLATTWFDFWTGKRTEGGRRIAAEAPISRIPVYVPAGSIIPLGPDVQYAAEGSTEPTELRVYPGKDADFALYDDKGDSYDYEKGMYAVIPMHWNDGKKTLTIGDQKGSYPGGPESREFSIVIVRENHGAGAVTAVQADKTVEYRGKKMRVVF